MFCLHDCEIRVAAQVYRRVLVIAAVKHYFISSPQAEDQVEYETADISETCSQGYSCRRLSGFLANLMRVE